jgi:hypothetical protein
MLNNCVTGALTPREHNWWIVFHTYAIVTYVVSLHGSDGLLLNLDGLWRHRNKGNITYAVIALPGQIKGEHHERCFLLPYLVIVEISGGRMSKPVKYPDITIGIWSTVWSLFWIFPDTRTNPSVGIGLNTSTKVFRLG